MSDLSKKKTRFWLLLLTSLAIIIFGWILVNGRDYKEMFTIEPAAQEEADEIMRSLYEWKEQSAEELVEYEEEVVAEFVTEEDLTNDQQAEDAVIEMLAEEIIEQSNDYAEEESGEESTE